MTISEGIWELQIFHRSAVEKGEWREGLPPGMKVDEACEAIQKLARARMEAQKGSGMPEK